MALTRARILFLFIAIAEVIHTTLAVVQHRVPTGHDGFQYFTVQYYFLNNAIQAHEIPQWIPYMTQGTVATLWYAIQASVLQSVLLYTGPLLRHADLLSVYHVGIFVDEMFLLAGTWCLAQRFFRPPAVFFIAVCVLGSCVWLDQPYWNFRLYYALPLVLELGHRFLQTGRWRWGFLSANLLALQALGNLPYFLPVASFFVSSYFLLFAAANWDQVGPQLRALRWHLPATAAIALAGASFVLVYACLSSGTGSLMSYNPGRLRDGTTSLAGFLSYGGGTGLLKWIDLLLNISPWLDFTIYAGALTAPLLLCGLFSIDRRRLHFVLLAVTMLLFTLGTFVSVALFYAWPGMKYFRHIGLVTPMVKVLFCFVAGVGFEWLFDPAESRSVLKRCLAGGACALLLASAAGTAMYLARSGPALNEFVHTLSDALTYGYTIEALARRLDSSGITLAVAALLMAVATIFFATPRARRILPYAVLIFVAVDVYHFKFTYLAGHSDVIAPQWRSVTQPAPLSYSPRRVVDLRQAALHGLYPRLQSTLAFSPMLLQHLQGRTARQSEYWSNNAFLFADEAGSSFRVDSWLKPLDQLMRANWRLPVNDPADLPAFVDLDRFQFPLDHPGTRRVVGVDADKIRFFAHAYSVTSAETLAPLMMHPSFAGNVLFVLPEAAASEPGAAVPWSSQIPLDADDTRPLAYDVRQFDSNRLTVSVANAGSQSVWMSYADVWHPFWQATVNGRPVPVYQGEMAYKAVPLEPGANVVQFRFQAPYFSLLSACVSLNAVLWLCVVGWIIMRSALES